MESLGKILGRGRVIFSKDAFFEHDLHGCIVWVIIMSKRGFARAIFAQRPVHDFGRRCSPVIDLQSGFFLKNLKDCVSIIGLKRSICGHFTFFFPGLDELGVLAVDRRGQSKVSLLYTRTES